MGESGVGYIFNMFWKVSSLFYFIKFGRISAAAATAFFLIWLLVEG
jgi:hypothetical protein